MAFPTSPILDDFTGANGTTLPAHNANWSLPAGGVANLVIQSNRAKGNGAFFQQSAAVWAADFAADCEVYAVFGPVVAFVTLLCRARETGNTGTLDGYGITAAPSKITWVRWDNGVATQLGAEFSQPVDEGDGIGLEIEGSTLGLYFNQEGAGWSSRLAVRSDSTYPDGGKIAVVVGFNDDIEYIGGGSIGGGGGGISIPVVQHHRMRNF